MSIFQDIEGSLNKRLSTCPNLPTIIAWPNVDKVIASSNSSFVSPTLLTGPTQKETFNGLLMHTGIYQINVFVPGGQAISEINSILGDIYTHFKTQTLTKNNVNVVVNTIARIPASRQDAWYVGGIDINFYAYEV